MIPVVGKRYLLKSWEEIISQGVDDNNVPSCLFGKIVICTQISGRGNRFRADNGWWYDNYAIKRIIDIPTYIEIEEEI